jgi:hypothetical protein
VNEDQLSPDGRWRWDGARWVPAGQAAPPPTAPRRSFAWVWWLAGGCAVLVVIGVIAAIVGLGSLFTNFQHGGFSCLPSTFPSYPGTSVAGEQTTYLGAGMPPGDTNECRMTLESNDSVSTVTDWYSTRLGSGDWTVNTDATTGVIKFQSRSKPSTVGTIELLGRGEHTEIRITLDT